MFNRYTFFLVPGLLFAIGGCAQLPSVDLQPNFAIQPVEQNASWAVDWWQDRHDEKIQQAKNADIELLMLGDSITHGWEDGGAEVWNQYYGNRKAFNLGFSGDRTEHVLWRLQNGAVAGMQPKLVVMLIGTNNTGHRMDPAAYTASGIELIVDELRQRFPESKVLLLAIFPRNYSPHNDMRLRNEEINRLTSSLDNGSSIHYLDISPVFLHDDNTIRDELMPDRLHPNAAGYALWAEAVEPTIARLLR